MSDNDTFDFMQSENDCGNDGVRPRRPRTQSTAREFIFDLVEVRPLSIAVMASERSGRRLVYLPKSEIAEWEKLGTPSQPRVRVILNEWIAKEKGLV